MVKIILETIQLTEPKFWNSWKGRIVRAIVIDGVYTRDEIQKRIMLQPEQFEQAFDELFQNELLTRKHNGLLWVNSRELCNEYRTHFKNLQKSLVDWVNQWRLNENIRSAPNHFYLEDRLLYEFSEKLIENAKLEILVANPYVKRCHISEALKSMSREGICVKLITRCENKKYLRELSKEGVSIIDDESAHAKLLVVDRCIGIASSMNYYAGSSGGALWEAGLVTTQEINVQSIIESILKKT